MGVHNFFCYGKGTDLKTAYRQAVEQAYFESGHDPYNGTISTTNGAHDASGFFPPRTTQRSKKMVMARITTIQDPWDDKYKQTILKELTPAMRPVAEKIAKTFRLEKWEYCIGCRLDKTLWCFVGWAAQ